MKPLFHIRETECLGEDHRVYQGKLEEVNGDFGRYWVGDFSDFQAPGEYVIDVYPDTAKDFKSSQIFTIDDEVYGQVVEKGLQCFSLQRCGPSTTGYHSPCHLDDGISANNGKFLDVVGGWHDASDLLKWSDATITGLLGLLAMAENSQQPAMMARIFEEAKWGNLYFLKLQDPQGYFYKYGIGGDPVEQGNNWTDNVRGTADDRKVVTNVGPSYLQHLFITAEAHMASLYRDWDAAYAKTCLDAAIRCFNWLKSQGKHRASDTSSPQASGQTPPGYTAPPENTYLQSGTGACAGIMLYRATGDRECSDYAVERAGLFLELQHTQSPDSELKGYFYEDEARRRGAPHIYNETFGIIGYCRFIEQMKKQKKDTSRWEKALALYCDEYLSVMAKLNAFGIVPYQVKLDAAVLPGARSYGGVSYRYFMCRLNGKWWVGSNANLGGTGITLCKAAGIFGDNKYRALAQPMLDWILGVNPFDVSLVNGIGYKNPPEYVYTGFKPRTPRIPGSEMCGVAGDDQDRPDLQCGSYHTSEIWTPMTIQAMWLISELTRGVRHEIK
jgi:hypothetical protein